MLEDRSGYLMNPQILIEANSRSMGALACGASHTLDFPQYRVTVSFKGNMVILNVLFSSFIYKN